MIQKEYIQSQVIFIGVGTYLANGHLVDRSQLSNSEAQQILFRKKWLHGFTKHPQT